MEEKTKGFSGKAIAGRLFSNFATEDARRRYFIISDDRCPKVFDAEVEMKQFLAYLGSNNPMSPEDNEIVAKILDGKIEEVFNYKFQVVINGITIYLGYESLQFHGH